MYSEEITTIAIALIALAGTAVAVFIAWFLKEKVGVAKANKVNELLKKVNQEFLLKQNWALDAVRFAEQALIGSQGAQKYNAALEYVSTKASEFGIEITPNEVKVLIEAQLHKIKNETKNDWTEITTKNPVIVTELTENTDDKIL